LRSVLKPDGAMYLMLYAPYGRAGVYMLQEYCRRLGVGISQREINELSEVLKVLPQHHPLVSMLRGAREALDADALVDALLNPRDRTYSVPELLDFVERNDLSFSRWYWQAPYSPRCGSITATPHAERLRALPEREQYTEMELLRGLISNHDFVVQQKDRNAGDVRISFDDERYLRYVPIRRPWTICVEERLPPGTAGVLLNQTHLFPDLYLMIDSQEKQIFEAIDGRRNIGEIVEANEEVGWKARDFFDRLWWYDQVVFDTSKA
jgi:hypothetical protein